MSETRSGTFLVGGAVRDALLGRAVTDRDWVVVGRTPEAMLAEGYTQVGRDFPVFLHPDSHEEYALARTERKTAAGHQGFECHAGTDVTLEEDLLRRDLTVNALAQRPDGTLVDPYGGEQDLRAGVLRHVSPAFAEDPLRILRVARFAAQLGFAVAPETGELMRSMAAAGALAELPAERVWQEFHKALGCSDAPGFIRVLAQSDALTPWFVEFGAQAKARGAETFEVYGQSALQRFGGVGLVLGAAATGSLGARIKAPGRYARFGRGAAEFGEVLTNWRTSAAAEVLGALQSAGALQADALERREDFLSLLALLTAARGEFESGALARLALNLSALGAAAAVQAAEKTGQSAPEGRAMGEAIAQVRRTHIELVQRSAGS